MAGTNSTNSKKAPPKALVLLLVGAAVVLLAIKIPPLLLGADDAGADQRVALDPKVSPLKSLPVLALNRPTEGEQYAPGRNLFDYSTSPEILELERQRRENEKRAAEERRKKEEERVKMEAARREEEKLHPRPPAPPPPPPPPTPPAFTYSYIGYFKPIDRPDFLAVLLKRTGPAAKPVPVKVGDTIDSSFVVKKIDFDVVVVGYVDSKFGDRTETVRLLTAPAKVGK